MQSQLAAHQLKRESERVVKEHEPTILTATKRVPHSDRSAPKVHLLKRNTEVLNGHDGLTGERLIDLEEIDILQGQTGKVEDLGNSIGGSDTHNLGRDTDDGRGDELAEDGETEALGGGSFGEEDGSCAIGDLGCVTCTRRQS